uniref:Olfactomedin-like 2Ba n=1 Tax=Hippocampus comes TaxID=109280 RepID=A0A3Q2YCA1_HIPCM
QKDYSIGSMFKWCVVVILVHCALVARGLTVPPKMVAAADSGLQNDTGTGQSLLGDYDKVKALSEGSDCRCQCVVRPLSRSACRRIEEGSATAHDSYTVETITSGPECKCACVAPSSAVNPCEGELRLKKLREAAKDDVKLATVLELLEGSYYGMDLPKLHTIISNLVDRVTHIEKENLLQHKPRPRPRSRERADTKSFRQVTTGLFHSSNKVSQSTTLTNILSEEIQDIDAPSVSTAVESDTNTTSKVTFAPYTTSKNPTTVNSASQSVPSDISQGTLRTDTSPDVTTDEMTTATHSHDKAIAISTTEAPTSTVMDVTTAGTYTTNTPITTATQVAPTTSQATVPTDLPTTTETTTKTTTTTTATTTKAPSRARTVKRKYKISWEEEEEDLAFDDIMQRQEGECKDTLATISYPVTHNKYGKTEGAWMKDPKSDKDRIYVTNFYYGNNLLEFQNMEVFKKGRFTNSYKLPYNWIGTGHVVYDGAFFFNRAFSRDIIKFDLQHRYVAAWTMLHDAVMEESTAAWEWRSHSDIDFALDESGLWIIYPAMDDEGFLHEVVVLSRLNPVDLSMQRETTWRTGLRRSHYGNCFIVCGVLYAVDSYNQKEANLEYAFDTHTNTQMIPRMPFTNNYTYTTQIDYNPKEGVLYAWDNGHQVTYDIKFAYVDSN